jgi:hypothetical protein
LQLESDKTVVYHGSTRSNTEKQKGMDSYLISFLWDTDFTDKHGLKRKFISPAARKAYFNQAP